MPIPPTYIKLKEVKMNFLTKHSKAFYYAYGILIAVLIIAGLFYASQYCDVRVLYSITK